MAQQALVRPAACPGQVGFVGDQGGQVQPDHDVPGAAVAPLHGNGRRVGSDGKVRTLAVVRYNDRNVGPGQYSYL